MADDSSDKKKKDFEAGFKSSTSSADLKDVAQKASDVLNAGKEAVVNAASSIGSAARSLFDDKNDSGGFLGDADRYKVVKKKP